MNDWKKHKKILISFSIFLVGFIFLYHLQIQNNMDEIAKENIKFLNEISRVLSYDEYKMAYRLIINKTNQAESSLVCS